MQRDCLLWRHFCGSCTLPLPFCSVSLCVALSLWMLRPFTLLTWCMHHRILHVRAPQKKCCEEEPMPALQHTRSQDAGATSNEPGNGESGRAAHIQMRRWTPTSKNTSPAFSSKHCSNFVKTMISRNLLQETGCRLRCCCKSYLHQGNLCRHGS